VRTAWGKRSVSATRFEDMDAAFEISDIGRGAGHLNFASGRSTRSPDTDYTGRYGFRCVQTRQGFATFWSIRADKISSERVARPH
jgi:hypothetical protein